MTQILRNLTCLKSISIDFSSCDELKDAQFKTLGRDLGTLTSLKKISLNFERYGGEITNPKLNSLRKGFQKLIPLKEISLKFRSTGRITDYGLGHLSRGLKKLIFLTKLHLQINHDIYK